MKLLFRIIFSTLILASIALIIFSLYRSEWNNLTAASSLTIAIISAWIAFETFRDNEDRKKPYLTLLPDTSRRYGLLQLILRNNGEKPAYKIKVEWNTPMINNKGEQVRFNKYHSEYDALILNGKQEATVMVNSLANFYKNSNNKDFYYNGLITYSLKKDSKKRLSEPFEISFEHRGGSLSFDVEEPKTHYELQKLPKKLDEIKKEIHNIPNIKQHE